MILHQENGQGSTSDTTTIIFTVGSQSPAVGKMIKELNLPPGVHFNAIKRDYHFFVPHGNVVIKAKDRITAMVMVENEPGFRLWLQEMRLKGV